MSSNYFWSWRDEYVRSSSDPDFHVLSSKWKVSVKDMIKLIEHESLEVARIKYQDHMVESKAAELLFDEKEVKTRHMKQAAMMQGLVINTIKEGMQDEGNINLPLLKGLNLGMKTIKDAVDIEGRATGVYEEKPDQDELFDGVVEYIELNSDEHRHGLAQQLISSGRLEDLEPERQLELLKQVLGKDDDKEE